MREEEVDARSSRCSLRHGTVEGRNSCSVRGDAVSSRRQTRELSVRGSYAEHFFEHDVVRNSGKQMVEEETGGSRYGDDTRRRTVEGESEQENPTLLGRRRETGENAFAESDRIRSCSGPTLHSGADSRRSTHEHVGCSAAFMKSFDHATRQGTDSFRNDGKLRQEDAATERDNSVRRERGDDLSSARSSDSSARSSTEETSVQLPSTGMQGIHGMCSKDAFRQIEFDLACLMQKLNG